MASRFVKNCAIFWLNKIFVYNIISDFIIYVVTMVVSNTAEYSQELSAIEKSNIKELNENEVNDVFSDSFFDDLKSNKIKKTEWNNWKIYFETDSNKFSITKEQREKAKDNYINRLNTQLEAETLTTDVQRNNETDMVVQKARQELQNNIQKKQNIPQNISKDTKANTWNNNKWTEVHEAQWDNIEAHVDDLLNWFDEFDKWPMPKKLGEASKSKARLKSVVHNDVIYLKSVKRDLNRYTYTYEQEEFQKNLDELDKHRADLETVRQKIVWWEDTSDIPTILNNLKDVKRARKFETKMNIKNAELNELLKDVTLKRLWNEDMEWLQNYLEDVWSGEIENPAQHPYYVQHQEDFAYIGRTNETLYNNITTPKKRKLNGQHINTDNNVQIVSWTTTWNCERRWRSVFDKWWEILSDLLVKVWVIDENDTTKKEARWKFGKVALLWLWAVALFKIITNRDWNRWKWLWWTAAALLALSNKDSISKWFKDAFGKENPAPNEILAQANQNAWVQNQTGPEAQEIIDNYVSPTSTVIQAIWNVNINTLISEWILTNDNGKFKFDHNKHKEYVTNNITDEQECIFMLQACEQIKDDPTLLQKWLENLWIANMEILTKLWESNDTLLTSDNVGNYINNLNSPINAEISKQWFKPKDSESRYKIMSEHNWKRHITDAEMAKYIQDGLIILKDESLNETMNSNLINWWQKCMRGCEDIKFSTYEELLKSVKLTEWIINEFKDKPARDDHPFHLWLWIAWNIEYNNWVINDIDVINSNIFKDTLEKISPSLEKNKRIYVDYLNALWKSSQI